MRALRYSLILSLILGLAVVAFFVRRNSADRLPITAEVGVPAAKERPAVDAPAASEPVAANSNAMDNQADDLPGTKEGGTVIAQLLRGLGGPPLSRDQICFIQMRYDILVKEREALESRLAQAEVYEKGKVLVVIPAYVEEGAAAYESFVSSLIDTLGQSTADAFMDACGQSIEGMNHGFGGHEQNMLIEDTGSAYREVFGGKRTVDFGGQPVLISGASSGILPYSNLSTYSHLRRFFPAPEGK